MISRKRLVAGSLILVFTLPFIAAWLAFAKGWMLSGKTTNRGMLITPPIQISTLSLQLSPYGNAVKTFNGKWWLVYLTDNVSDATSQRTLYYLRQIRQATGKNRDRVEVAVLTNTVSAEQGNWLHTRYPRAALFLIQAPQIAQLKQQTKKLALEQGSLYLVDPLGNIMMLYAKNAAPKGILKDLERVLKVSQIG